MVRVCLCSFANFIQGILDGSLYIIFPAKSTKNPMRKSLLYVKTAVCWAITQRVVVIPYPPVGTIWFPSSRVKKPKRKQTFSALNVIMSPCLVLKTSRLLRRAYRIVAPSVLRPILPYLTYYSALV